MRKLLLLEPRGEGGVAAVTLQQSHLRTAGV